MKVFWWESGFPYARGVGWPTARAAVLRTPFMLHFAALLAGYWLAVDSIVIFCAWVAAFAAGWMCVQHGRPIWEAAAAGAWFPTTLTAFKIYWWLGMPSAGSGGDALFAALSGEIGHPVAGVFLSTGTAGILGWLLAQILAPRSDHWGRPF